MKIEITKTGYEKINYEWKMWDGPEGIDFYEGDASTLGECFERILINSVLNSIHYK